MSYSFTRPAPLGSTSSAPSGLVNRISQRGFPAFIRKKGGASREDSRWILILMSLFLFVASAGKAGAAGELDLSFNPGVGANGPVNVVVRQPDGKVLVGGAFTTFQGQPWKGLVRLNINGGIDTSFGSPGGILGGVDPRVEAIALQEDGRIVIGGEFTSYRGVSANRLARLNSSGSPDGSFRAPSDLNGTVKSLAIWTSGRIFAAGAFTVAAGHPLGGVVLLTGSGQREFSFGLETGANGTVNEIRVISTGRLVVVGNFTAFNDVSRSGIAVITSAGQNDTRFEPGTGFTFTSIETVLVRENGLLVGGNFTAYRDQACRALALIGHDGALDHEVNPLLLGNDANGSPPVVHALAQDDRPGYDPGFLVGGSFSVNGATSRRNLIRHSSITNQVDTDFQVGSINGSVQAIAKIPTSREMTICGTFTSVQSTARAGIARLDRLLPPATPQGLVVTEVGHFSLRLDWDAAARADQYVLEKSLNGTTGWSIVVGSPYNQAGPAYASGLEPATTYYLRVSSRNSSGDSSPSVVVAATTASNPPPTGTLAASIQQIRSRGAKVIWSDARFEDDYLIQRLPAGLTTWIDAGVVTANSTAFTDTTAAPGTTCTYRVIARNSFGQISSATVSITTALADDQAGMPRDLHLPDFGVTSPSVLSAALQPNGCLLACYLDPSLSALRRLVRFLPDGHMDPAFQAVNVVDLFAIHVQADGKIVIAGSFSAISGTPRANLARLHSDGTLDNTFANGVGQAAGGPVSEVKALPDGKWMIAGSFTQIDGQSRGNVARLLSDGALDPTFATPLLRDVARGFSTVVNDLAVTNDGGVLIAGRFDRVGNHAVSGLAKLLPNGDYDPEFVAPLLSLYGNSSLTGVLDTVEILADGRVLIGGTFNLVNQTTRRHVARLFANGVHDPNFNPSLSTGISVNDIAVQPDGKILLAGSFTVPETSLGVNVLRLNGDGTSDASFFTGTGVRSSQTTCSVNSIIQLTDGSFMIHGFFETANGLSLPSFSWLYGDQGMRVPGIPSVRGVEAANATHLRLYWDPVESVTGYLIERSLGGSSAWQRVGKAFAGAAEFMDSGLLPGTRYVYRLSAQNSNGTSPVSNSVDGVTRSLFAQWQLDRGFSGAEPADGDSNGNGIPLLGEYAFGIPSGSVWSAAYPVSSIGPGDRLTLRFTRMAPDVDYHVEWSSDLKEWHADSISQMIEGDTVSASIPLLREARFMRVHLTVAGILRDE